MKSIGIFNIFIYNLFTICIFKNIVIIVIFRDIINKFNIIIVINIIICFNNILNNIMNIKYLIFDLDDTLYSEKQYLKSGFKKIAQYLGRKDAEEKYFGEYNHRKYQFMLLTMINIDGEDDFNEDEFDMEDGFQSLDDMEAAGY